MQEIATKINKVPFEQIASDLRTTLATLNKTLTGAEQLTAHASTTTSRREITAAMKDARKTHQHGRPHAGAGLAAAAGHAPDAAGTDPRRGSVRVLTDYLERHPESLLRGKPEDKK